MISCKTVSNWILSKFSAHMKRIHFYLSNLYFTAFGQTILAWSECTFDHRAAKFSHSASESWICIRVNHLRFINILLELRHYIFDFMRRHGLKSFWHVILTIFKLLQAYHCCSIHRYHSRQRLTSRFNRFNRYGNWLCQLFLCSLNECAPPLMVAPLSVKS